MPCYAPHCHAALAAYEMKLADRIRQFAAEHYVVPARAAGRETLRISAGILHQEAGLRGRVPAVCSALQGAAFLRGNGLELIRRDGPPSGQGTRVVLTYRLAAASGSPEGAAAPPAGDFASAFRGLRGAGRGAWSAHSGGEAVLRAERRAMETAFRERELSGADPGPGGGGPGRSQDG